MAVAQVVGGDSRRIAGHARRVRYPSIFTDRDELHLGCNDALTCVPELSHGVTGRSAKRLSAELGAWSLELRVSIALRRVLGVRNGEIAIIDRLNCSSLDSLDVAAVANPFC